MGFDLANADDEAVHQTEDTEMPIDVTLYSASLRRCIVNNETHVDWPCEVRKHSRNNKRTDRTDQTGLCLGSNHSWTAVNL